LQRVAKRHADRYGMTHTQPKSAIAELRSGREKTRLMSNANRRHACIDSRRGPVRMCFLRFYSGPEHSSTRRHAAPQVGEYQRFEGFATRLRLFPVDNVIFR
jgi:hypothetical protein